MGPEPIATLVRSSDTQALSDSLASMGARDIEAELVRLDDDAMGVVFRLSLIHISEPTRLLSTSYAVFCL